jgi:hypothetical protein
LEAEGNGAQAASLVLARGHDRNWRGMTPIGR